MRARVCVYSRITNWLDFIKNLLQSDCCAALTQICAPRRRNAIYSFKCIHLKLRVVSRVAWARFSSCRYDMEHTFYVYLVRWILWKMLLNLSRNISYVWVVVTHIVHSKLFGCACDSNGCWYIIGSVINCNRICLAETYEHMHAYCLRYIYRGEKANVFLKMKNDLFITFVYITTKYGSIDLNWFSYIYNTDMHIVIRLFTHACFARSYTRNVENNDLFIYIFN